MRRLILISAIVGGLLASGLAGAQQPGNGVSAEHNDVGSVQMRLQRYDQAIGAVSQLRRSPIANVECNGVCYFPNSSQSIAWKCDPEKRCDLRCTVSPPVGGCELTGAVPLLSRLKGQREVGDAGGDVEAGVAFDADGLQRYRIVRAADENVCPKTHAHGRAGGHAAIIAGKRAGR